MKFRNLLPLFIFSVFVSTFSQAQLIPVTLKEKGTMYFLGGLNRNWFTTSDISYKGAGYDFTFLGLKAHDKWQPDTIKNWGTNTPQFSFRMGYIFKGQSMVGMELSIDHIWYVVDDNQKVHLSGTMGDTAIADNDTIFAKPSLGLQHANGSTNITLSFVKQFPIVSSQHDAHVLLGAIKAGGGILMPKSDVRLFGVREVHNVHLAGYVFGVEASVRYTFIKHIALEIGGRGSYVNYSDVLTVQGGSASHNFLSFEAIATLGYQFKL